MSTTDIALYETGSGGDFSIVNNDLLMGETLYQQIYLALFGGNVQANTKPSYLASEDRYDYWGNQLVWKEAKTKQFNSETERTIQTTTLNSSGRLAIIQAINQDLEYLKAIVNLSIQVEIVSSHKIRIIVSFSGKTNQQDKLLQLVYDNSKKEVIIEKEI
jgi:phage gp46-like protein